MFSYIIIARFILLAPGLASFSPFLLLVFIAAFLALECPVVILVLFYSHFTIIFPYPIPILHENVNVPFLFGVNVILSFESFEYF